MCPDGKHLWERLAWHPPCLPAPSFGSDACTVFPMTPQGKRTGLSWVPAGRWCFHCIFPVVFQGKCYAPCLRVEVGRCREVNFISDSHTAPRRDCWDWNVGVCRGHADGSPSSLLELRAAGLGKLSVAPAPPLGSWPGLGERLGWWFGLQSPLCGHSWP